jgi:hypothetical protein
MKIFSSTVCFLLIALLNNKAQAALITYELTGEIDYKTTSVASDFGVTDGTVGKFDLKLVVDDSLTALTDGFSRASQSFPVIFDMAHFAFNSLEFRFGDYTFMGSSQSTTDNSIFLFDGIADGFIGFFVPAVDLIRINGSNETQLTNGYVVDDLFLSAPSLDKSTFGRTAGEPVYSGLKTSSLSVLNNFDLTMTGSLQLQDENGVNFEADLSIPESVDVSEPSTFLIMFFGAIALVIRLKNASSPR